MGLTLRAGLRRSCPIPSGTVGTISRQREKESGTRKVGKFPGQREKEIPDEPSSSRQVQDSTPPLSVIPAVFNSQTAGQAGIQLPLHKTRMDPGLRRDDEQGQHSCKLDDAPPQRLALQAIRDANVRAGILPSQSCIRGNDKQVQDGTFPLSVIPAQAGIHLDFEQKELDDAPPQRLPLRSIRDANVRSGILPAQSGLRRDDENEKRRVGQLDALRRLIRARERPQRTLQPKRALSPPAGDEIAPGLRYVETRLAYPAGATIGVPAIDEAPIDRRRLLCFDTETTGLAGGVGTRAFMIGVAAWADDVLTVRQLYLTAIAGERAMLQLFADWLQEDTILVSYNGKSYDAPLLKGRLRLSRVAHRLAGLPHIDWLHPTRRIYKGHLPNCKLATIEREVLRIVREDDLPGSEAPAAWLAYLRGQSSINLARVIEHNRQDVITLMRLGDHITSL